MFSLSLLMTVIFMGIFIFFLVWIIKQLVSLKEAVSQLQQKAIDLDYNFQKSWANNSDKIKRLFKQLKLDEKEIPPIHSVVFKNIDRKMYVTSPKMNLLTLAKEDNIAISTGCYGEGTCGQCAFLPVEGFENLSPCTEKEKVTLQMFSYPKEARLSCQCKVNGNVTVELLQPLHS